MKCYTVTEAYHIRFYGQVPLNVVNKTSTAASEFFVVIQELRTIVQGLAEISTYLREGFQVPFVIISRVGLFRDILYNFVQLLQIPGQMLDISTKLGILPL